MADFLSRAKKINTIELINSDPLLSQFKHHFILMKVYLPRKMNLENFAQKIPEGFGLPYNLENSVYIAQLVNVYDEDLVDVAVGFRRDETAIKIARRNDIQFKQAENRSSKVHLSTGFQIFMEELRNEELQQQKIKDDYTNMRTKKSDVALAPKPEEPKKTISQQKLERQPDKLGKDQKKQRRKGEDNSSPSRSRSRQKKKKQIFNRLSQPEIHKQKSITERITGKKN